jgi:hypothetical protein
VPNGAPEANGADSEVELLADCVSGAFPLASDVSRWGAEDDPRERRSSMALDGWFLLDTDVLENVLDHSFDTFKAETLVEFVVTEVPLGFCGLGRFGDVTDAKVPLEASPQCTEGLRLEGVIG